MNTPSIKLAELLKQIDLPYRFGSRIDGFKVRTIRDDQNQRLSVETWEEDAFYIVHAANVLPEIIEAMRPFSSPEFVRILGGNVIGDESPLFGRNGAILTIGDFKRLRAALDRAENVLTEQPTTKTP